MYDSLPVSARPALAALLVDVLRGPALEDVPRLGNDRRHTRPVIVVALALISWSVPAILHAETLQCRNKVLPYEVFTFSSGEAELSVWGEEVRRYSCRAPAASYGLFHAKVVCSSAAPVPTAYATIAIVYDLDLVVEAWGSLEGDEQHLALTPVECRGQALPPQGERQSRS